ncbi:hypothetical protein PTMSG1_07061 [Pyrenophora teres f. maculata]|nr:hypothetical protein PTMSG1_07061 [Pyrenophora teres f. maculata]
MTSTYTSFILPTQAYTQLYDLPPLPAPQLVAVNKTNIPETLEPSNTETTEPEFPTYPDSPSLFPILCPTEEDDETLLALSIGSPPELRTGIFTGVGLVEPVTASQDTSTRRLRRTGKLVLRRLNMAREIGHGAGEKGKGEEKSWAFWLLGSGYAIPALLDIAI